MKDKLVLAVCIDDLGGEEHLIVIFLEQLLKLIAISLDSVTCTRKRIGIILGE